MIWLTWRQFRIQALVTLAAILALGVYLVVLGFQSRHAYNTDVVGCLPADCEVARDHFTDTYNVPFQLLGALLIGVPFLIGVFWGAPLITRELEERTHKLVWNQSVTRTQWLAIKLGFIALFALAAVGLLSLLLTWSASRFDQVDGNRFAALNFGSRNIVPLGYVVFAFVLGTMIGLLVRRTVPAMALTLAVFAVVQIVVPTTIRAHLLPAEVTTVQFTASTMDRAHGFRVGPSGASIMGFSLPGTWSLTSESNVFNADGTRYVQQQALPCIRSGGDRDAPGACMAKQNLHFSYTYQPASRYWPFQWIELSGFLVLSALLAGLGFWRIRTLSN